MRRSPRHRRNANSWQRLTRRFEPIANCERAGILISTRARCFGISGRFTVIRRIKTIATSNTHLPLTLLAATLLLTGSPISATALDGAEAGCRKGLSKAITKYALAVTRAHAKCHLDRLGGKVDPAINCNASAQLPSRSRNAIEGAEQKAIKLAVKKCTAKGVTPTAIGLHACESPCGTVKLLSFDGADGATACLACRAQTSVVETLAQLHGSPSAPSGAGKCLKAVSSGWYGQSLARMKAGHKCQQLVDAGKILLPSGGCTDTEGDKRVTAAIAVAQKKVEAACAETDLADLDVCGGLTDKAAVLACITNLARENDTQVFSVAFEASQSTAPITAAQDYANWYWPGNHRPTETWPVIDTEMHFMTGHYAFTLDEARGDITSFGPLTDGLSMSESMTRPNSDVTDLPPAVFRLEAGAEGSGIIATSFVGSNGSTIDRAKMIDGGRFMNRIEIPTVGYAADAQLSGRLQVASMPRHVAFSHTVQGASAAASTARIVLGGDFISGLVSQWLEADRALSLSDGQGGGWIFIASGDAATLSLSGQGEVIAETTVAVPPAEGVTSSLIVIPAHAVTADELTMYLAPQSTVDVTYTLLDLDGNPAAAAQDVAWDASLGAFRADMGTLQNAGAPGSANFDDPVYHHWHGRHRIEVDTGGIGPIAVPMAFHGSDRMSWYIVGGAPLMRDEDGDPSGVALQISKNWHGEYWYHLYAQPTFSGRGSETMEMTMASSKWGDAYAASHAQLSLIGWGEWGGHWDETAVGCFGESITYDPDMTLRRSQLDDVRPVLVDAGTKWRWTGNVGGGDFLNYNTAAEPYWKRRHARVRKEYNDVGPLLTDVSYSGVSSDGRIEATVRTQLGATDDLVRAYYHLEYHFLNDVEYDRLGFFQIAADNYSDNLFANFAWGDATHVEENRSVDDHMTTGYSSDDDRGIPLTGESPWVMLYDNERTGDSLPERYANTGYVVRNFRADIGGTVITTPHINLRRTYNQSMSQYGFELGLPDETGSPWCGDACGGQSRFVPAGSSVSATIEYLVPPADASRYYGESAHLLALPAESWNSTAMMLSLASGNHMEVETFTGTLLQNPPIEIRTVLGQVAADIRITGGLAYTPLTFHGLERHEGWRLEREISGVWETVDQSVHGKDFAQVDYDSDSSTWSVTVAVPIDGGGRFRLLRE